jgi:hypothetical protein
VFNNFQDILITLGIVAWVANIVVEGLLMKEEPIMVSHYLKLLVSILKTLFIDICDSSNKDNLSPPNVIVLVSMNSKITEKRALSLVEISQNVTSPFTTTCDLQSFMTRFGNIATTQPNFNYFGHSHNYDPTIRNFILLVRLILHLFSSINRVIYPISRNSHQISCILMVLYNDIGVYFNICAKIIYNMHMYIYYLYNEYQN